MRNPCRVAQTVLPLSSTSVAALLVGIRWYSEEVFRPVRMKGFFTYRRKNKKIKVVGKEREYRRNFDGACMDL